MPFDNSRDSISESLPPTYTMLIGMPGSRKSTYAKKLMGICSSSVVCLSTDTIIELEAANQGKTYSEVFVNYIDEAQAKTDEQFKTAILKNCSIIHDQTNLTVKSRRSKLSRVPLHYYKKAILFPLHLLHPAEWQAGLNNPDRFGKVIPPHVLDNMMSTFQIPSTAEGFDEISVFNYQHETIEAYTYGNQVQSSFQ